jgi:hypothetical protein
MELVKTIYESNFRDVPATLRRIADEIEAGNYGEVSCVGLALLGDSLEVFGIGPDSEAPSVALVLNAGVMKLTMPVLHHGT